MKPHSFIHCQYESVVFATRIYAKHSLCVQLTHFFLRSSFALMTRIKRHLQFLIRWWPLRPLLLCVVAHKQLNLNERAGEVNNTIQWRRMFDLKTNIKEIKCKLSPERTQMSDIYKFFFYYFDFINKINLQQKRATTTDLKEFDPLSWNLSNGKSTITTATTKTTTSRREKIKK